MTLLDLQQIEASCDNVLTDNNEFIITQEQFKEILALAKKQLEGAMTTDEMQKLQLRNESGR